MNTNLYIRDLVLKKHLPLIEEKRKSNIKSKEKVTIAIFAEYNGNNVSAVCS